MPDEVNGDDNGNGDDYPDEGEQLRRALRYLARAPKQSLEVTLALLKQKIWEVGSNVIEIRDEIRTMRKRQDLLWNDYQQRLGRERLVTWWLALLTLFVAAVAAYATVMHSGGGR